MKSHRFDGRQTPLRIIRFAGQVVDTRIVQPRQPDQHGSRQIVFARFVSCELHIAPPPSFWYTGMRKGVIAMFRLRSFGLCLVALCTLLFCGAYPVCFSVDTGTLSDPIGNKVGHVNVWDMGTQFYDAQPDAENNVFDFVDYVQLMQCSGGTASRDLFRDPENRDVTDDYDFTRLLNNCAGILQLGAKPLLKLGSVPCKYSAQPLSGGFGMNVRPPEDYDVYYRYIRALAEALVERFGAEEVRAWRFGVMTEFENADWFCVGGQDADASAVAYCKLYDYTVQALLDVLGEDVFVGAHAMAVTEGLWDEEIFIRHVAVGTNYATGQTGTHIDYLSASFYDTAPGRFTRGKTLEQTIGDLRKTAESYGLRNLRYGVDEGRIYGASAGADNLELASRTVGQTWQAAYDARMWTKTIRSGIDYFSSWGYLSGGLHGYPTVSYHVASCVRRMAGGRAAATQTSGAPLRKLFGIEADGAACWHEDTQTANVLLYNFRNKLTYRKRADAQIRLHIPQLAGQTVCVTAYRVNDECNFFDEWQADRQRYGIGDDCFSWSPDDPCLDYTTTLSDPQARELYRTTLRERYIECARLTPDTRTFPIDTNGDLTIRETLDASAVLFLEISRSAP